jgi:mono/diheme cytochrome c family protein
MRLICLAVALNLLVAVSAHAAKPIVEPGDVARGRAFVKANCSSCHAVGRVGHSPYRPAPPLRTLNRKYDVEGLAEAFAEGIIVGHKGERQMPEFVLEPGEIDDLIAYLKSLKPRLRKSRH